MNKIKVLVLSLLFIMGCFLYTENVSAQSYIVNPNKTYTYSDMVSDITKLKKAYPDLITVKSIGKTEYGRDIYAVSLGKGPSTVFINGSHHAREWMTTNLNMNMIDKYSYAYKGNQKINGYDVRKILTNTTIWFVPMVNPDGVILQQSGLSPFPKSAHAGLIKMNNGSKNFKRWKANGKGVDLNRQYNAKWSQIGGPKAPSFKNFKGKAPHTAKETKAIVLFVSSFSPEIAVSYHSSGEILFWNYQQTGSRYNRDYAYAKTLGRMTGYDLVYPKSFNGGGGFSDWFSRVRQKTAFTIEIAPFAGETNVPLSRFSTVWKENMAVGLFTSQEGGELYDSRQLAASKALEKNIKSYDATARKLQAYYDTNVKSGSNLKVDKPFRDLYNKVNGEIKKNETAIAKLPSKYRALPVNSLKTAKTHRDRSANFINGVTAGDSLVSSNNALTKFFNDIGNISGSTVVSYQNVTKAIPSVDSQLKKMYGTRVLNLAKAKYISPATISKDNLGFEIYRYQLIEQMKKQVTNKQFDAVKLNLAKYDKLTQESAAFKAKDKAKYITYKKAEDFLQAKRTEIENQLPKTVQEPEPNTPASK